MKLKWRLIASHSVTLVALMSLGYGVATAQNNIVERKDIIVDQDKYRDIASDLRCPTCTGLSVLDSDAAFSVQIKNEVREQMVAGKDKDAILKFFTERYGPWILRAPPTTGVNLWAWLVPILILILGPVLIWIFVWRRRVSATGQGEVTRSIEDIMTEMNDRLNVLRKQNNLPTKRLRG